MSHVLPAWLEGVKHVCFDKDGTLIDVHRYWAHTARLRTQALRKRYSLPQAAEVWLTEAMGVDPRTGRIRAGGPVGYEPRRVVAEHVRSALACRQVAVGIEELLALFGDVDRAQQDTDDYALELLPGVARFLEWLSGRKCVLSIYTSDRRDHVLRILQRLGLESYMAEVVGGGCVARPKPDPEGFTVACKRVGTSPAQSIYIGDTMDDLAMGLAGGACRVIGVTSGLGTVEELSACTPYVCGSLAEAA